MRAERWDIKEEERRRSDILASERAFGVAGGNEEAELEAVRSAIGLVQFLGI